MMVVSTGKTDVQTLNILSMCFLGAIPANADIDCAIDAHRMAFEQFSRTRNEDDHRLAAYAIRAVVYAALPTREHAQRQIDYLTALPMEAWHRVISLDAADLRETTLAMCARSIAMRSDI